MSRSIIRSTHCMVRLRENTYVRGRRLTVHGQHGSLYCLPLADALRLVENGQAKLPAEASKMVLIAAVQRQRERDERAAA